MAEPVADVPRGRRPPIWTYALALTALVALGLVFGEAARAARATTTDNLDRRVLDWVVHHRDEWPGLTRMFLVVTLIGNTPVATGTTIALTLVLYELGRRRVGLIRRREAPFWFCVATSGRLFDTLLKDHFRRERPPLIDRLVTEASFSFPSGHSVFAAILFTMIAILINRALPTLSIRWRIATVLLCGLMAVLVGASRIWLSVHYVTDVVGGLVFGLAWVEVAYLLRFGWGRWRAARLDGARAG